MIGTTSTCDLKLFRNSVALEKDEEQVSFINMRIKALQECLDQDEEIGAKNIADTERFQQASREPIPRLGDEPGELIELDNDLREDPAVASLFGVDKIVTLQEESSQGDEDENDVETLIAMLNVSRQCNIDILI